MSQIVKAITASSEFKELERLRAKARHDEAQALYHAEQKGIEQGIQQGIQRGRQEGIQQGISERNLEIARMMLADNAPIEHIVRYSGLSKEEILGLS